MLRVSKEIRERVLQLAQQEFEGASVDETIRRLLDEHWEAAAVAAVEYTREHEPHEWEAYLAEARGWAAVAAPGTD